MCYNVTALRFTALAALLLLAACKEPLYTGLDEVQTNEMVAILQASGIEAGRRRDKDGLYEVMVTPAEIGAAVTVLRGEGYPKRRFASLGEVFPDEGIVGTPFEERARFMFALNEELSHTVSEIAGIRSARVQVMIPPQPRYGEAVNRSSASVALHYEPEFEPGPAIPTIKSLIAHSVPHLEYDRVEIAAFPASGMKRVMPATDPPDSAVPRPGDSPAINGASLLPWGDRGQLALLAAFAALIVLGVGVMAIVHGLLRRPRR